MSGNPAESGPSTEGDRSRHRRDVQGMRALAVALVIAYHAGVPDLTGGFIGVDVFFVISGYVITNLLLSQLRSRGRVSVLGFYGRRAQRIIPLAAVVIVATVVASYSELGFLRGKTIAVDGQWAAAFAANLHFASQGTDYLGSQLAPSPLQHYWSLSVEEQFYVVWPVLLWLLFRLGGRGRRLVATAAGAGVILVASYVWSGLETHSNGIVAYFSTLTRACELMAGALLAITAAAFTNLNRWAAEAMAVAGLAVIIVTGFVLTPTTPFPGWVVALPVVGTALLIASGMSGTPGLVGRVVLGNRALVLIGDLSFSLYLWHWPLLTIAQEARTTPLPGAHRLLLVCLALALSLVTYYGFENPLRRSRRLKRHPAVSVTIGLALIGVVFAVLITELYTHPY